jgi:hypothetical protein
MIVLASDKLAQLIKNSVCWSVYPYVSLACLKQEFKFSFTNAGLIMIIESSSEINLNCWYVLLIWNVGQNIRIESNLFINSEPSNYNMKYVFPHLLQPVIIPWNGIDGIIFYFIERTYSWRFH